MSDVSDVTFPTFYAVGDWETFDMEEREYVTVAEACEILGVSRQKVWRLMEKDKVLPYIRDTLDKRVKLIKREDVERLKASSKKEAA